MSSICLVLDSMHRNQVGAMTILEDKMISQFDEVYILADEENVVKCKLLHVAAMAHNHVQLIRLKRNFLAKADALNKILESSQCTFVMFENIECALCADACKRLAKNMQITHADLGLCIELQPQEAVKDLFLLEDIDNDSTSLSNTLKNLPCRLGFFDLWGDRLFRLSTLRAMKMTFLPNKVSMESYFYTNFAFSIRRVEYLPYMEVDGLTGFRQIKPRLWTEVTSKFVEALLVKQAALTPENKEWLNKWEKIEQGLTFAQESGHDSLVLEGLSPVTSMGKTLGIARRLVTSLHQNGIWKTSIKICKKSFHFFSRRVWGSVSFYAKYIRYNIETFSWAITFFRTIRKLLGQSWRGSQDAIH